MPKEDAMPRRRPASAVLAGSLAIIASQVWAFSDVLPRVPGAFPATRSPSSDVLLQAVPLPDAAARLDGIAADLPPAPGVVVAHGRADAFTSAYFVITMRLWPRSVTFVACEPTPHVEQFRVPHPIPPPVWRLDLRRGAATPIELGVTQTADPAVLCGGGR